MTDALGPSGAPGAADRASVLLNHPRYAEWKAKYGAAFRKHITI